MAGARQNPLLAGLVQPESVLPTQFYTAQQGARLRPEWRLMVAVLSDAVDCFQKYARVTDAEGKRLFDEAREWIESGNRRWPFSFVNICEALGINPEYLREGLWRWHRRAMEGPTIRGYRRVAILPNARSYHVVGPRPRS